MRHIGNVGRVAILCALSGCSQLVELPLPDAAQGDLAMPVSPDQSMPDQSMPDQSMPDQSMPDQSMPDLSMSDQSMPDQSMPDQSMPDQSMPDLSKPDLATPDPCAGTLAAPPPAHQWTFNDGTASDSVGGAGGMLLGGANIANGRLVVDNATSASTLGFNGQRMQAPLADTTTVKTLVSWVSLSSLTQRGGSALSVESTTNVPSAQRFDAVDYGERTIGQWMSGSENLARSPTSNGGASETSTGEVMIAIVYGSDNSITLYRDGVVYAASYTQGMLQTFTGGASDALIGLRHSGCSNNCWLSGAIDEARIYPVALNACQIKTLKPAPNCPTGSLTLGGKCYKHVKTRATQPNAEADCQASFGGHLASIHSAAQNHALSQYVDPNGMAFALEGPGYGYNQPQTGDYVAWIGGVGTSVPFSYSATGPGTGAWTDGSTWDYSSWRRNYIGVSEPTDSGNVNGACLIFIPDTNVSSPYNQIEHLGDPSGWNDANCSGLGSYLCEFNP